jgi:hypothetical protein
MAEAKPRLCPADVMERYQCTNRRAFQIMREAGAFKFGESLRCTEEQLERWEQAQRERSVDAARKGTSVGRSRAASPKSLLAASHSRPPSQSKRSEDDYPRIRPTQPKRRKVQK